MESAINLFCPACGAAFLPRLGCCGRCLAVAVHVQSGRFGTELSCAECGRHHIVLRVDASRGIQTSMRQRNDNDDVFDSTDPPARITTS